VAEYFLILIQNQTLLVQAEESNKRCSKQQQHKQKEDITFVFEDPRRQNR
jgi:hypothetical protein